MRKYSYSVIVIGVYRSISEMSMGCPQVRHNDIYAIRLRQNGLIRKFRRIFSVEMIPVPIGEHEVRPYP